MAPRKALIETGPRAITVWPQNKAGLQPKPPPAQGEASQAGAQRTLYQGSARKAVRPRGQVGHVGCCAKTQWRGLSLQQSWSTLKISLPYVSLSRC